MKMNPKLATIIGLAVAGAVTTALVFRSSPPTGAALTTSSNQRPDDERRKLSARTDSMPTRQEATPDNTKPLISQRISEASRKADRAELIKLWNEVAASDLSAADQMKLHMKIARQMSAMRDYSSLITLIDSQYGEGLNRAQIIHQMMAAADVMDAPDLIKKFKDADRAAALKGLPEAVSNLNSLNQLQSLLANEELREAVVKGLRGYLAAGAMDEDSGIEKRLLDISELLRNLKPDAKQKILSESVMLGSVDKPFEIWEMVGRSGAALADALDDRALDSIVAKMVSKDPARAMEVLKSSNTHSAFEEALRVWAKRDKTRALSWFESASSTLSPEARDWGALGIAENEIANQSLDKAREWIANIESEDIQAQANQQLRKAQVGLMQGEMRSDPTKVVLGFLDGNSKYDPSLLQDGIAIFLAQNPEAAGKLVGSKLDSMTAEQKAWATSPFVSRAEKMGDMEAALAWAEAGQSSSEIQRLKKVIESSNR